MQQFFGLQTFEQPKIYPLKNTLPVLEQTYDVKHRPRYGKNLKLTINGECWEYMTS